MKRIALAVLAFTVSSLAIAHMHGQGKGGAMQSMERDRPMQGMDHGGMPMSPAAGELADGEVRKVDRDAGKLTLRHGPIASLDMPAMTMVYGVKDKAMLEHLSAGDKVKFAAEKTGAGFTVTRVERAK